MPGTKKQTVENGGSVSLNDPGMDYSSGAAELRGEVYRPPEYLEYLEKATVAMRTIRLVVYAGMTGFIILAFYGFFLIYQLTYDVQRAVDQMLLMTQQMQAMARILGNLDDSVSMMETSVGKMEGSVAAMNGNVATMSQDLKQMGNTVALMQHSARNLDQSIGPVMGTVNRMMPFGWPGNSYGGSPPYAPPMR